MQPEGRGPLSHASCLPPPPAPRAGGAWSCGTFCSSGYWGLRTWALEPGVQSLPVTLQTLSRVARASHFACLCA